ncbi:hypothetical protein V8C37DRAFT_365079 [Trichoderma ceciliae]
MIYRRINSSHQRVFSPLSLSLFFFLSPTLLFFTFSSSTETQLISHWTPIVPDIGKLCEGPPSAASALRNTLHDDSTRPTMRSMAGLHGQS